MMKVRTAPQGSSEWLADRARHYNAADAAAMLGCDPNGRTRTQLLDAIVTGYTPQPGEFKQRLFDKGHQVEAMLRPLAEAIVGEDLYPLVGGLDVGLSRPLGASFDGLTMARDVNFECKSLNEALAAALPVLDDPVANDPGELPKGYRVQMEQQLLVSGAERVLFGAASFDADGAPKSVRWCWYISDAALRAEILAGWKQLDADAATHVLTATEVKPSGRAPESLPALRIEITGAVTASNLAEFKENALAVFARINRTLTTDADFADAEKTVKWCGDVEGRLKAAKEHALSQTASIDALFKTIDDIAAESKRVRLDLDKLVTARKAAIKLEIVQEGKAAYDAHETALRAECGCWTMLTPPDFAGCIKNLRTVDSIRDAVQTTLANAKIKADESARTIRAALAALDEESKGYEHLFRDRLNFINMIPEAVRLTVRDRLASHKAAEEKRLEGERERIRAEEQAKAERDARAKLEAEQRDAAPAATQAPAPAPAIAAAPNVLPMQQRVTPTTAPTLRLGEINARIAPLSVSEAGLAQLGFRAAGKDRSEVLYHDGDFPRMCDSIVAHLRMAQQKACEPAAA